MENSQRERHTKIAVGFMGEKEVQSLIKSIESEPNKVFDRYLVAYIDFLGITDRMKAESSYDSLQYLKALISSAKKKAFFIKKINSIDDFVIKIFSDNIVIAQRIKKDIVSDQIISIINLVSLMQFEAFFQFDFPLRGGITIGELFIDETVVWGRGLIEAYQIENGLANYPRVLVSKKVIDEYETCQTKSINLYSMIKQDTDGYWFVDYLLAAPNINLIPNISESLASKAELYANANERVRQKVNWIISYFNSYCDCFKDRGDFLKYKIDYI